MYLLKYPMKKNVDDVNIKDEYYKSKKKMSSIFSFIILPTSIDCKSSKKDMIG